MWLVMLMLIRARPNRLQRAIPISAFPFTVVLLLQAVAIASGNTVGVISTNDSGAGSLRQALSDAENGDTIVFAPGVTGMITLTSGELTVGKSLAIFNANASLLTVSGNNASGVFSISNVVACISGLTIANGSVPYFGGGIANHGSLNLSDCVIKNNFAGTAGDGRGQGGGVFTDGPLLNVNRCAFSSNTAAGNGGAIQSTSIDRKSVV